MLTGTCLIGLLLAWPDPGLPTKGNVAHQTTTFMGVSELQTAATCTMHSVHKHEIVSFKN
ncbi:hypothetical protein D3C76_199230 [compost metagenome]|jgi:hypothetical protein